jgi:Tfp pilus assembly major pilin PilA
VYLINKQQRGLTLISWLVVIAVTVFIGMVAIKSLPVYLNHYKIVSILKSVANQSQVTELSMFDIRQTLERRFDIDMVKHLDERQVKVVGNPGSNNRMLIAQYEVRIHMFYNIDTVYAFDEQVPIK